MLHIQNTLLSLDLLEKHFVCDLQKCKGACCVKGDAGAPLTKEEISEIENIYEIIKSFMKKEGINAVEKLGKFTVDEDGEKVTTLVNNKECAYVVFEKNGSTKCAFELSCNAGKTNFKKPISCHLYPVRISKYNDFDAVNFHEWEICKSACECGKNMNVKIYEFVKEGLIRKYGEKWFEELKNAEEIMNKNNAQPKGSENKIF